MIVLDTSVLIANFVEGDPTEGLLRETLLEGDVVSIPTLVLYEWLRGPRREDQLQWQKGILPSRAAIPFGPAEAALSAEFYRSLPRARDRQIDLAIAACAILHDAQLWTLNPGDFRDIPGLNLYEP